MRGVRSDYGADFLIEEVLIAVHRHLMRSADQLQSVDLVELLRDICAEDPSRASEVAFEATLEPRKQSHPSMSGSGSDQRRSA